MITIILEQTLLYLPLTIGAYISISLMKLPDLSLESAFTFGAILASKYLLAQSTTPTTLPFTIIAALAGGLVVGLTSSLLTQKAKIPHLLSSIMTVGLFHGINQAVLGTSMLSLTQVKNTLAALSFMKTNPELPALAIIGILLIVLAYLFLKTQLGYCLMVYGDNPRFFEHHRISGSFVFFVGMLIANSLAGLSGYLVAQTSGFIDTSMGLGAALFCITALILGKTLINTKHPASILVPTAGVSMYFAIQQLLLKCGFNLKYFTMIQATIVLIILVITLRKKGTPGGKQTTDTLGV